SAVRTPIGKFLGSLSSLSAPRMGALVVAEAIRRAGVSPDSVDEVIMGNVLAAGLGQNPARQAALFGGLPPSVGAVTVNKVCGSGLKAVMMAAQAVRLGDEDIVVAGGMESMTRAPFLLEKGRTGYRLGHGELVDSVIRDGLWDVYNDYHMGNTGEVVATEYNISREEQDAWAVGSHTKALADMDEGRFKAEILPLEIKGRKGDVTLVENDEAPRRGTSMESLAKLRPVFQKNGTVTAGNAPGLNDGAAATVVTSAATAGKLGCQPLARIIGYATAGLEPRLVLMAPEAAVKKLAARIGWSLDEVDLFEFNEAFSVQQVALARALEIPAEKVNVNGGAVALGHPIGASGARVLTTLLYALKDRGKKRGVAALCLGGGNAVAMAVEVA
ncbi:MAG: acetyl-CoA C-acetyltransferase, partial [Acidobacteria bacterium]|nr:acetyl-CoA C-acetyltransferase [Acidobacteriota bacterium]